MITPPFGRFNTPPFGATQRGCPVGVYICGFGGITLQKPPKPPFLPPPEKHVVKVLYIHNSMTISHFTFSNRRIYTMRTNKSIAGSHSVRPLFTAGLALAMAITFGCSGDSDDPPPGGGLVSCPNPSVGINTLTCGSQTYKTIEIGGKVWMAENLKYAASGSKCGDESTGKLSDANTATCDTYGRLYNWATAIAVCPDGWHLPTNGEWTALTDMVGEKAGTKLKADSDLWNSNGKGTDEYGFAALPGGYGNSGGHFGSVGDDGNWWSASESIANLAYYRDMSYGYEGVDYHGYYKDLLFSVRCLQD